MRRISVSSLSLSARFSSEIASSGITPHCNTEITTSTRQLLGQVFWVFLPSRQHGNEVIPTVQDDHHQVAEHEGQNRPHDQEMPQPRPMETTHHPRQPGKLHWFPYGDTCHH